MRNEFAPRVAGSVSVLVTGPLGQLLQCGTEGHEVRGAAPAASPAQDEAASTSLQTAHPEEPASVSAPRGKSFSHMPPLGLLATLVHSIDFL